MHAKTTATKKQTAKKDKTALSKKKGNVLHMQHIILDSFPEIWISINGILKKLNGINVQMEKDSKAVKLKNETGRMANDLTAYYD